jgi:selT/selW/selH-like putative selenoprotein
VKLVESRGGAFEIKAGDILFFSKLKEHRFPEDSEVLDFIKKANIV